MMHAIPFCTVTDVPQQIHVSEIMKKKPDMVKKHTSVDVLSSNTMPSLDICVPPKMKHGIY